MRALTAFCIAALLSAPASAQTFTRSMLFQQNSQSIIPAPGSRTAYLPAGAVNPSSDQGMITNIIQAMGVLSDTNTWSGQNTFTGSTVFSGPTSIPGATYLLQIGTTPVGGGANGQLLYDNAGFLGGETISNLWASIGFSVVNAVSQFGADPTGATDSTAAIRAAVASVTPGSGFPYEASACVYLPAGNYVVSNAITLGTVNGCLFGDGRTLSVLNVSSSTMNLSALGVVVLPNTSGATSSWVHDIGIQMVQPDVSTRASIVAFPPGVYAQGAGRALIENVRISGGSYCIDARGNAGGAIFNNIECGALVKGLQMDGALDAVHIDGWHHWNFYGLETTGLAAIFCDGTTELAEIGRVDGLTANNVTAYCGNMVYTSNANNSEDTSAWSNVILDAGQWQQSGGYNVVSNYLTTDGGTTPPGSATLWGPAVQVGSGALSLSNFSMTRHNPTSTGAIEVNGGALDINSTLQGNNKFGIECVGPGTEPCITETSGTLSITNSFVDPINGGVWSQPYIYETGGVLNVRGTWWEAGFASGYTAIDFTSVATSDVNNSSVQNNNFNGWVNTLPFSNTALQYGMNLAVGSLNSTTANYINLYSGAAEAAFYFSQLSGQSGWVMGQIVESSNYPYVIRDKTNNLDAIEIQIGGNILLGSEATSTVTGVYGSLAAKSGFAPSFTGSCSVSSPLGGQAAGSFKAASGCSSTQTVILTFAASQTDGYACDAHDMNTPTTLINQTATNATSVTFTLAGAMATNDVATWKCVGY